MDLKWKGVDRGREQFLHRDAWHKVLAILASHEGENHRDLDSSVFDELQEKFPKVPWKGKDGNRSFFRDYAEAWTTSGVVQKFADTEGEIHLTGRGMELVDDPSQTEEFFREYLDNYVESHTLHGEDFFLWPFAYISSALSVQPVMDTRDLQDAAEILASTDAGSPDGSLFPQDNDDENAVATNNRRFRTYLILLENAHAITRVGTTVSAIDLAYLRAMVPTDTPDLGEDEGLDIEALLEDKRTTVTKQIVQRERQRKFSDSLLEAYASKCCVTGNSEVSVLEGAHILPYRGRQSNKVTNGLLLSVDVHRLFDRFLLGIDPDDFCVHLSPIVSESRYTDLEGSKIILPALEINWPDREALRHRFDEFKQVWPENNDI